MHYVYLYFDCSYIQKYAYRRHLIFSTCVAAAWSSSDDNAICCVLPVLWMTSCILCMMRHAQITSPEGNGVHLDANILYSPTILTSNIFKLVKLFIMYSIELQYRPITVRRARSSAFCASLNCARWGRSLLSSIALFRCS